MKIVAVSDLHLDAVTAGYPRFDDAAGVLRSAVEFAMREPADLFVFCGDLVDPDRGRAHDAVAFAIAMAGELAAEGIPQMWLTGNHDVIEDGRGSSTLEPLAAALEAWPNACGVVADVVKVPCVYAAGRGPHVVVCLPYVARSNAYDPVAFIESIGDADGRKVLVFGHLMLPGISPGSEATDMARGRDIDFPIDACVAKWGARCLMFNGHIHERQVYRGVQVIGAGARFTFGEEKNDAGFLLIEVQ